MLKAMFVEFIFFYFNHVLYTMYSVHIWDAQSKGNVEYRSKSDAKSWIFIHDNIQCSHWYVFASEKSSV